MNAPLLIIPLAIEWVILVTTLAPVMLVGRFATRPRIGLTIWFATFLSAGLATITSVLIAFWAYTDTVSSLTREEFGGASWLTVLLISFAPWLALAAGGVSLALINQRIEPLVQTANQVKPLLDLSKSPLEDFMNVPVFTVDLPFAYALATNQEILISSYAINHLSKDELNAVLWHEYCHVKQKHFALKQLAKFIREVSPRLAASRALVTEVQRLIEIAADQSALNNVSLATLQRARSFFEQ